MTSFAEAIGRVMMAAVRLPRPKNQLERDLQTWAEIEYKGDANYAYHCMIAKKPIK